MDNPNIDEELKLWSLKNPNIDEELKLWSLKNKLIISLKNYLINANSKTELNCFYRILDLLKEKYVDDYNFIENGIICNINNIFQNNTTFFNSINDISSHIFNCNNKKLLKDILNSVLIKVNNMELFIDNLDICFEKNVNIT
jgi:hypothetical protein